MKGFQVRTPAPASVVVLRALPGLGDMLCAIPALRSLRASLPDARISLLGLPQSASLLQRYPTYIDEVIEFPGFPGLPEREPRIGELPDFFSRMQARGFDLVLQMHGSGVTSNAIAMLLGGRHCAGFHLPGQYRPPGEGFIPWPDREAEVRRLLRLTEHLGFPARGETLEFPLWPADRRALATILSAHSARGLRPGGYACVHPGASVSERRWPAGHFARIGDELAGRGLQVVLTGSSEERPLAAEVEAAMEHRPLNLAGATDLGALAVLLAGARLLICNDTGISHLAAALATPSVVVFIATPPERWAPLNTHLHRVVDRRTFKPGIGTSSLALHEHGTEGLEEALTQARELLAEEYCNAAS